LDEKWVLFHVTMAFLEIQDTFGVILALWMKELFVKFNVTNKIIIYVKDEGRNLNIFVIILTSIVSCVPLQIDTPCFGTCFKHLMFKAC
jgi:hypothetical protein